MDLPFPIKHSGLSAKRLELITKPILSYFEQEVPQNSKLIIIQAGGSKKKNIETLVDKLIGL